jgi:hypothetical protein
VAQTLMAYVPAAVADMYPLWRRREEEGKEGKGKREILVKEKEIDRFFKSENKI